MGLAHPLRSWLEPPRHLIALFLLVTLVPSLTLVALGWKLFRDDRDNEARLANERGEQALDVVVSTLERSLTASERSLREASALSLSAEGDAVVLTFTDGTATASPPGGVPYLPISAPLAEAPPQVFEKGEELEFRTAHPGRAAAYYERQAATSSGVAVRAGALIRLARSARAAGQLDRALASYDSVRGLIGVAVAGVPADLLARWARCDLLATMGRTSDLRNEAGELLKDLQHGRWPVARAVFELHLADAARWAQADGAPAPDALARAAAAQWLWTRWKQLPDGAKFSGRSAQIFNDRLATLIWTGDNNRATALIAGPRFVDANWLGEPKALLARQPFEIRLLDAFAGRLADSREARRTAFESGLPWTVAVTATDSDNRAALLARRRALWLAGFGLLGVLVLPGTYVVARTVSRELTVARLQSDFVSAVSHEFRTPLTTLRQLTELLLDRRVVEVERRRTYLEALARQTERLQRLVESLLDFGRMEAGTSPYWLAPLELAPLVRSVVRDFADDPAAGRPRIETDVDDHLTLAAADPDALRNALWNLLDNAVKYSPKGAAIHVRVRHREERVVIEVEDSGLGIAPQEQRDIFRKFVRGSTAIRERIKGTGIGLAIVQHIVTAHGGTVVVESEPGRGSTFTITLPSAGKPADSPEMSVDGAAAPRASIPEIRS
jgi:signal transduction histidine kinase